MNKIEEIRKMPKQDILDEIKESEKKLFKLKFEVSTGASKANHEISKLKQYIARMKTVVKEMESADKKKFDSQKTV